VPWGFPLPSYEPPVWTHKVVIAFNRDVKENGWADPPELPPLQARDAPRRTATAPTQARSQLRSHVQEELFARETFEGPIVFEEQGETRCAPRNPRGRTGLAGRGLLGKWGPNHAADPIVTRFNPLTGKLQMVAVCRKDTGAWAIPGGMVDAGETVSVTVRREFEEEAGAFEDEEMKRTVEGMLDELFAGADATRRRHV